MAWRMANIILILLCFSLFYRLTWVQRCWHRATFDSGSASVISSFLLQDVPSHDTRLVEVREAFKRTLLLGFRGKIRAYIEKKSPPAALPGALRGACAPAAARNTPCVACCGPLINALVNMPHYASVNFACDSWHRQHNHHHKNTPS